MSKLLKKYLRILTTLRTSAGELGACHRWRRCFLSSRNVAGASASEWLLVGHPERAKEGGGLVEKHIVLHCAWRTHAHVVEISRSRWQQKNQNCKVLLSFVADASVAAFLAGRGDLNWGSGLLANWGKWLLCTLFGLGDASWATLVLVKIYWLGEWK